MKDMEKMDMERERNRSMKRREMEKRLQKEMEVSPEISGPGSMTKEQMDTIQKMMKMDEERNMKPKGYKKGGMVTRGQGAVMRKKSCKMC